MISIPEYDLHAAGMLVEDALAKLDRVIAANKGRLIAVITGYGSTGGTSRIKRAVLERCRHYVQIHHLKGCLDGEKAGDMFSAEFLAFPNAAELPAVYGRTCNPGVVLLRC